LRRALARMRPQPRGSEVTLEMGWLFERDMELMRALDEYMKQHPPVDPKAE
jgi:hypothetical protein